MWPAHLAHVQRLVFREILQGYIPTLPSNFLSQLLHCPHATLQIPYKTLLFWFRHNMTFPMLAGSFTVKEAAANLYLRVP